MDMAIDSPDPEISRRRRIVYTGLTPYLEGDKLIQALWIWENQFAQASTIQFRHYVSAIAALIDAHIESKKIYLSLVSASFIRDLQNLKPDPYNEMIVYNSPGRKKYAIPPSIKIFSQILKHLQAQLNDDHCTAFYQKMKPIINKNFMFAISQEKEMRYWLRSRDPSFCLHYDHEQLRDIIHYVYLTVCEITGPVYADQILASTIDQVKALPEARKFNPKYFL